MNSISFLRTPTLVDSLENLQDVTRENLSYFIEEIAFKIGLEKDPILAAERLSEVLPDKAFSEDKKEALIEAKSRFEEAKHFLKISEEPSQSGIGILHQILDSIINLLGNLIEIFDISCLFKVAEHNFAKDVTAGQIWNLINLFQLLADFSIPVIGANYAFKVIGGITLSLSGLSLFYPYIKPVPTTLPKAENWTMALEKGELKPLEGRKEILDEIASTLKPENIRPHVLLLGKSGVGKTETAKAFAKAVLRGDYPELAGKQVFYLKTPELVKPEMYSNTNESLSRLKEAMGRHPDKIILIFDEIHVACQKRENIDLCNELKLFLTPDGKRKPCAIGITTKEEYAEYIQPNAALDRRFHPIHIENTTKEETLSVLHNSAIKSQEGVLLENGDTLNSLLDKVISQMGEDVAQPLTAATVLDRCIQETSRFPKTETKLQKEAVQKELIASYFARYDSRSRSVVELEEGLAALEAMVAKEEREIQAFIIAKKSLMQLKAARYKTIQKVNTVSEKYFKELLVYGHLITALDKKVKEKAKDLQIDAVITEEVIDKVIQKELESQQKKESK